TYETGDLLMPSTRSYSQLHDRVAARPGAAERLAALRKETLAEIGLYELRRALDLSQTELAAELGITQSAVSQIEHSDDLKFSTLRAYLERLGARLELFAVFEDGDKQAVPIRIGDQRVP